MIRFFKRLIILMVLLVLGLLAPIAWVEVGCRGKPVADLYQPLILDPSQKRNEARSYLTYPEWYIVHAYDDYARVISTGDPHDYRFIAGIRGFWSSLCALSRVSGAHGGFDWETKQTIYTIGVSFTAELLAKAAYEETIGRLVTFLRGSERTQTDQLTAQQAAAYAAFLQQTPWYKWDFEADNRGLQAMGGDGIRDRERRFAIGLEYAVKAAYARAIAKAVEGVGNDELTIQSVVAGLDEDTLRATRGVEVIGPLGEGVLIETPRYREFTLILEGLAARGANMVEIAGNDDIMLTALAQGPLVRPALDVLPRQGASDFRYLISVKVADLLQMIRDLPDAGLRLEHVHDY